MATVTSGIVANCPRCWARRVFINVSGGGVTYRCAGCEWLFTLGTKTPTGTISADAAIDDTALTVASGGASFTNGMFLLLGTGAGAEVVTVNDDATATSVPVQSGTPTGEDVAGLAKAHTSGAAFGQLTLTPLNSHEQAVPANSY